MQVERNGQWIEYITYPQITEAVRILLKFINHDTQFNNQEFRKWLEDIKRYCIDHTAI